MYYILTFFIKKSSFHICFDAVLVLLLITICLGVNERFGIFSLASFFQDQFSIVYSQGGYFCCPQINASDHGNPPRSVTTKVTVDVVDENDNTPYITLGSYIVKNISEVKHNIK